MAQLGETLLSIIQARRQRQADEQDAMLRQQSMAQQHQQFQMGQTADQGRFDASQALSRELSEKQIGAQRESQLFGAHATAQGNVMNAQMAGYRGAQLKPAQLADPMSEEPQDWRTFAPQVDLGEFDWKSTPEGAKTQYFADHGLGPSGQPRQPTTFNPDTDIEFQRALAMRDAGIGPKGTSPVATAMLKGDMDRFADARAAGVKGQQSLATVDQLIGQIQGGMKTGRVQSISMPVRQFWSELTGMGTEGIAEQEFFDATTKKLLLEGKALMGGGILSDSDIILLTKMTAGLDRSEEGNLLILEAVKKVYQRQTMEPALMGAFLERNGNLNGYDEWLKEWANENPLFPEAQQSQGSLRPENPYR